MKIACSTESPPKAPINDQIATMYQGCGFGGTERYPNQWLIHAGRRERRLGDAMTLMNRQMLRKLDTANHHCSKIFSIQMKAEFLF